MLNRIVCFLFGHEYQETSTHYGKLDNGLAVYRLTIGDCIKCGKKPKELKKPDVQEVHLE